MKAGTHIRLPDGREGTVVYNGLDGIGIKWGLYDVTINDILGSGCALIGVSDPPIPDDYRWHAEAMLRKPYKNSGLECVGDEYEVIEQ